MQRPVATAMSQEAILEKVRSSVAEQLSVDSGDVKPESNFQNDLGADSLDTVELVMALEDCLLYTSPSPRDGLLSRMPSSA